MSFECPKCGYRDPPCWRNSRFVLYAVYCTLNELEIWNPDLVRCLRHHRRLEKGPYVYYLRGSVPHVYRIRKDLEDYAKANKTEKYRPPLPKNQLKLESFLPKEHP